MKIKHTKNRVTYAMRVDKDRFVKTETSLAFANAILNRGKEKELSDKRGYGMEIVVDDTYFFPADTTEVAETTVNEVE